MSFSSRLSQWTWTFPHSHHKDQKSTGDTYDQIEIKRIQAVVDILNYHDPVNRKGDNWKWTIHFLKTSQTQSSDIKQKVTKNEEVKATRFIEFKRVLNWIHFDPIISDLRFTRNWTSIDKWLERSPDFFI